MTLDSSFCNLNFNLAPLILNFLKQNSAIFGNNQNRYKPQATPVYRTHLISANGTRSRAPPPALFVQCEHSIAVSGRQAYQACEHQRSGPRRWKTCRRTWIDLDHHPILPGERDIY